MEAYNKAFRPELRNRIDEVIVFHHLDREEIHRIVSLFSRASPRNWPAAK
jgi:ATP-dependent Clp protease ATP-binding subunit ClpA